MSRRRRLLAGAIGLLLIIASLGVGQAAGAPDSLAGTVVDGTAGAALPTGLIVRLDGTTATGTAIPERTAAVGAGSQFAFDQFTADPSVTYTLAVDYGGATYTNALPHDGSPLQPTTLTIYEPTTSDQSLGIDAATWVVESIDLDNQQITVLETLALNNASDRTFVGDHNGDPGSDAPGVLPRTLRILLPPGASGFAPQLGIEPSTTLPVENGIVDTRPILPGLHQIGYTYHIAYSEGGAEIRKALPYPTKKLRFLGPDAGLDLRSDLLTPAGSVQISNRPFLILATDNLPANTVVTVDIFGLPSSPVGRLDPNLIQIAGLIAIVLAVLVALYLAIQPARSAAAETVAEHESLVASIASLDDAYASGKLGDELYYSERDRQKRQLVDLLVGDRELVSRSGDR
jgi:hypothetical protein